MKISYSQVEVFCNELHEIAKNMREILDNVSQIGSKVSSSDSWTGSASDFYTEKFKGVAEKFDEIFCEMENSILFMAKCSDGYKAIDEKIMMEICNNLNIVNPSLNTSKIFE